MVYLYFRHFSIPPRKSANLHKTVINLSFGDILFSVTARICAYEIINMCPFHETVKNTNKPTNKICAVTFP